MAVAITFSSTNGGSTLSDPVSHGNISNGAITTPQVIYIRHNGVSSITACGFYIDIADSYTGDFTAVGDLAEVLGWGDAGASNDFGGFEINMNATGSFAGASWPSFATKTTADTHGVCFRTGVGDSALDKITIQTTTGATSSGTIQAGASPNVRFSTRMAIPNSLDTLGVRSFKLILAYTYTS